MEQTYQAADDIDVLPMYFPIPGFGNLPINAFQPRPQIRKVYIGRLSCETTSERLQEYLTGEQIDTADIMSL